MKNKPFSDVEYGRILDHIVVACVDTAVTHKGKIFLIKREVNPAKDSWWIFGGRVNKGESLQAGARRGLLFELSLDIDVERFAEIGIFNLIWPVRREPIETNGCHHLLIAHQVEISDSEKAKLDNVFLDDDGYRWIDLKTYDNADLLPELKIILSKIKLKTVRSPLPNFQKFWLR